MATVPVDFLLQYQDSLVEAELFKQQIIKKMQEAQGGSAEAWKEFAEAAKQEFDRVQKAAQLTWRDIARGIHVATDELKSLGEAMIGDSEKAKAFGKEVGDASKKVGDIIGAYRTGGPIAAGFAVAVSAITERFEQQKKIEQKIIEEHVQWVTTMTTLLTLGPQIEAGTRKQIDADTKHAKVLYDLKHALGDAVDGPASLQALRQRMDETTGAVDAASKAWEEGSITEAQATEIIREHKDAVAEYSRAVKEATKDNKEFQRGLKEIFKSETTGNKASDDPYVAARREEKKADKEAGKETKELEKIREEALKREIEGMKAARAAYFSSTGAKNKGEESSASAGLSAQEEILAKMQAAQLAQAHAFGKQYVDAFTAGFESADIRSQIERQLFPIKTAFKDTLDSISDQLKSGFGSAVGDAFGTVFDNISKGEKLFKGFGAGLQAATAKMLKSIGTGLIAQGVSDELKGLGLDIIGDPQGAALNILGGIEIGEGLLMGGAGGLLGKRGAKGSSGGSGGGGGSRGDSSGSLGRSASSGLSVQAPVIIYIGGGAPGSTTYNLSSPDSNPAAFEDLGHHIAKAIGFAANGGNPHNAHYPVLRKLKN